MKPQHKYCFFLVLIAFICAVFYYFQVNLSTDLIILFIAQKLFLGSWLSKGIMPLLNPHIFAGIPFVFDVGMGNLHPFNLFFLLPYPLSFSIWIFTSFSLFLVGFYYFFRKFTSTDFFAFFLVLVLFFSGSGYWRINNPTIFLVIAHYGFFFYFLEELRRKSYSLPFIIFGILMALSGHIQFVLYGYILSLLIAIFAYKISWRKLFLNYLLIGISIAWYFIFSLPLVVNSTRITSDKDYLTMGRLPIQQVLEFLFPFIFGYVRNGSSWNVGPTFVILISSLFTFFLGVITIFGKKKKILVDMIILLTLLLSSFGLFNFPFFRAPSQILLLFHVWGLVLIAQNETLLLSFLKGINKKLWGGIGFIISTIIYLFFSTPLFTKLFLFGYVFIKKRPPNLFFDIATITAIGRLVGLNFVIYIVLFLILFIVGFLKKKEYIAYGLIVFVIFEGVFVNYFHNTFIPQGILTQKYPVPSVIDSNLYRVQTGSDVIPYFGFHNYIGNILFRPPFSKEKSLIDINEERNFPYLKKIMSYYPSTWSMTYGLSAIQGYNTFVTKDIADYFKKPSADYTTEYAYIIQRNGLFGQSEKGLAINGIETSKITLGDPRWGQLGVRYFITDRPLKEYSLLQEKKGVFIYENTNALPIYRIADFHGIQAKKPFYMDPNQWKFHVTKSDVGKEFQMVINPSGFVAKLNGKEISVKKGSFLLQVPLKSQGDLVVFYSPARHLKETLESVLKIKK